MSDGIARSERRKPGSQPSNELYLAEHAEPLNVSREHLRHHRRRPDRGGEARGGTFSLHDGDVIIVGTSRSPYVFKFRVG